MMEAQELANDWAGWTIKACSCRVWDGPDIGGAGDDLCLTCNTRIARIKVVPESALREQTRRLYAYHARVEQLEEALRDIAMRPLRELNPDGKDQAAYSMQLIARDALSASTPQPSGERHASDCECVTSQSLACTCGEDERSAKYRLQLSEGEEGGTG